MLKYLIPFLLFICSVQAQAQFTRAEVSVNGLTCSQCSRSVEMALKRLDFIAKVEMDLQQPTAHIVFKKNKAIDFAKLARAVRNAGFAVGTIVTHYQVQNNEDVCVINNNTLYYPVKEAKIENGQLKMLLLGKGLISDTELKKYVNFQSNDVKCSVKTLKNIPYSVI